MISLSATTTPKNASVLLGECSNELEFALNRFAKDWGKMPTRVKQQSDFQRLIAILDVWMPELYSIYDRYIQLSAIEKAEPVFCGSGCSTCCKHYPTSIEPFELLYLHAALYNREDYGNIIYAFHQRASIFQKLAGGVVNTAQEEDELLYTYFLKNIPCPMLAKDGSCSIYAFRPMTCRMFISFSEPKYCGGTNAISELNRNYVVELPDHIEVILSQISYRLHSLEIPQHLFAGLVRVNELFGAFKPH